MIFVCGVHGNWKTEYCKNLAKKTGRQVADASQLPDLRKCQDSLVINGNLCQMDQTGVVRRLPLDFLRTLNMDCLIVLTGNAQAMKVHMGKSGLPVFAGSARTMKSHISESGLVDWEAAWIEKFQEQEIRYAKELSKKLPVDVCIVTISGIVQDETLCSSRNIVLPVKPVFAEAILNGYKKYEYRKQLCLENIHKIYLYATASVKGIVGETEVTAKLIMQKERLWNLTKEQSGISWEYFAAYFAKNPFAGAYQLGHVVRYGRAVPLEQINIFYTPQSYVYVGKLNIRNCP